MQIAVVNRGMEQPVTVQSGYFELNGGEFVVDECNHAGAEYQVDDFGHIGELICDKCHKWFNDMDMEWQE